MVSIVPITMALVQRTMYGDKVQAERLQSSNCFERVVCFHPAPRLEYWGEHVSDIDGVWQEA